MIMKTYFILLIICLSFFVFSCSEDEKVTDFTIIEFFPLKVLEGDRVKLVIDNLPQDKKNLILEVNKLEFPIEQIIDDTLFAYIPKGANTGKLRLIYKSQDALSNDNLTINKFEIIDFIPNVGFIGDVISISGNGFTTDKNQLKVQFNGVESTILQSNETTILAIVPQGATTGRVKITYNGSSVTSVYDFKVANNPTGGGGAELASDYMPSSARYYLFDNWEYDETNKRTGAPTEDSVFVVDNVSYKSYPSSEYNIFDRSNFQLSKKYYRTSGSIIYADGASEAQLPQMIADQIGSEIEWVPILDLQNLSWTVYEFKDMSFSLPFNGQNVNIKISSKGNAKRIPTKRIEKIAGKDLEVIEVEYTFTSDLTITFGIIPIQQEIETKTIYWFSKGYGIVKEITLNNENQGGPGGGLPIGGGVQTPGERILKKIYN